jgi:hypothetical protein
VPIETPEAPKLSIEALQAVLPALVASAGARQTAPRFSASLLASPRSLSSPSLSYPVYVLGLVDVASEAGLGRAKLSAWRHEFVSGSEVVAAEVTAGRRPQFSGLNVNSRFRSVQQEVRSAAEAGGDFAGRSYEPRLLQVSALGVRALWLKSKARSHADIVIPLAPTRAELTVNRHYSPAEFIAALKSVADAILKDDAPGKGA